MHFWAQLRLYLYLTGTIHTQYLVEQHKKRFKLQLDTFYCLDQLKVTKMAKKPPFLIIRYPRIFKKYFFSCLSMCQPIAVLFGKFEPNWSISTAKIAKKPPKTVKNPPFLIIRNPRNFQNLFFCAEIYLQPNSSNFGKFESNRSNIVKDMNF